MYRLTYPNQRTIKIHREPAKADFLGIKNANWQAASRDLGAHALQLYLYLAANANNYTLALSPAAVRQEIGMARSTYHDQFHKLVDKGYLVSSHGNTYEFYEVPQTVTQAKNELLSTGLEFEENPFPDKHNDNNGLTVLPEDIEINNMTNTPNNTVINKELTDGVGVIQKPKVREIVISLPGSESKKSAERAEQAKQEVFEF